MRPTTGVLLIGGVLVLLTGSLTADALSAKASATPQFLVTEKPLYLGGRPVCVAVPSERSAVLRWWESLENDCRFRSSSVMHPRVVSVSRSPAGTIIDFEVGLHRGVATWRVVMAQTRFMAPRTRDSQPLMRASVEPTDPYQSQSTRRLVNRYRCACGSGLLR